MPAKLVKKGQGIPPINFRCVKDLIFNNITKALAWLDFPVDWIFCDLLGWEECSVIGSTVARVFCDFRLAVGGEHVEIYWYTSRGGHQGILKEQNNYCACHNNVISGTNGNYSCSSTREFLINVNQLFSAVFIVNIYQFISNLRRIL